MFAFVINFVLYECDKLWLHATKLSSLFSIARETHILDKNIKAIGITTYERGFVVLYEEAESDLMESGGQGQKENISLNISHAFSESA